MRDGLTGLPVEVDSGETGRTGQVEAPVGRDEVNTQDVATGRWQRRCDVIEVQSADDNLDIEAGSVEVKSGTTRDEDQTSNSEADAGPKENDDEHTMRQKHTKN